MGLICKRCGSDALEAFEDKKGTVKIELSEDDKNVKITIQDDGKGMPPETVEKLIKGKQNIYSNSANQRRTD